MGKILFNIFLFLVSMVVGGLITFAVHVLIYQAKFIKKNNKQIESCTTCKHYQQCIDSGKEGFPAFENCWNGSRYEVKE